MFGQQWLWLALFASRIPSVAGLTATTTATATYVPQLFRRDGTCPANTFQCSEELGSAFSDICCQTGQTCALDANNSPACCPSGAVCTGTAPATAATGAPVAAVSYVPNSYFSFPYAPTSYDNRDTCSSAVKACSRNYDSCVSVLGDGGSYGVTIDVPGGGGTTVAGVGANVGASATPICSSLSSEACSDLEATQCVDFGSSDSSTIKTNVYLACFGVASVMLSMFA
ncbi:Fc.00g070140.m01.CDS01 [Cosmosporella sp. VM-42]